MEVPASQDSNRKTRQIIIFAAIAVLLAALLLGGFYFAKYRGEQAANPDITEVEVPESSGGENAPVGEPDDTPPVNNNNNVEQNGGDQNESPREEPVDTLPSSGPTENLIVSALMLAVVTYAVTRYAQSRHQTQRKH